MMGGRVVRWYCIIKIHPDVVEAGRDEPDIVDGLGRATPIANTEVDVRQITNRTGFGKAAVASMRESKTQKLPCSLDTTGNFKLRFPFLVSQMPLKLLFTPGLSVCAYHTNGR